MKNILLTITALLALQVSNAKVMSAVYYEVEGTVMYDIKGCPPGSNVAFYSEKYGGKQLKATVVNGKGELLYEAEEKFKPAFVLNSKKENSSGIKGSGVVIHFADKEFSLNSLEVTQSVNGLVLSWEAAFFNSDGYTFEVLKSTNGEWYEPVASVLPSSNSATPYAYTDPEGTAKTSYKIRIANKGNGVDYTSRVLTVFTGDNIAVYPTAANESINIAIPAQYKGQAYSIINAQGQVVQSGKLEAERNTVKVSELSAGSYFVNVADKKQTAKFIKL